jgi:hypothetical protein
MKKKSAKSLSIVDLKSTAVMKSAMNRSQKSVFDTKGDLAGLLALLKQWQGNEPDQPP